MLAGCAKSQPACEEVAIEEVITGMSPASVAAWKRALAKTDARACARSPEGRKEAAVFSGRLTWRGKEIEDELVKEA